MSEPDLSISIGTLKLNNPVMVASGTFGFGQEYAEFVDVSKLGAVVVKGISLEPSKGNPPPRTVETPSGMLNAIGLENPGLEGFVRDKLPWLRRQSTKVIVNIYGSKVEEYGELAKQLDRVEGVDALEVNISCPNVKQGGMAFGADSAMAYRVAATVRKNTTKPVLVKLTPNVTDLVEIASRVAESGVDGLTLVNTLRGMAIDVITGRPLLGNLIGGLSGPAIRPVAIRAVFEVSRKVSIPIVGCGGIVQWQDAVEFMRAGARAVQIGSATFRNPMASLEVLDGLGRFLLQMGIKSCRELVDTVCWEDDEHMQKEGDCA